MITHYAMNSNQITSTTALEKSFRKYLFDSRRNRLTMFIIGAVIVIQFIIFKFFYPYAGYIHGDSFLYLDAAYKNQDINFYLVGYSKFLRLFSVFLNSDIALAGFQYVLIQSSALLFLFTLFYFYRPGKLMQVFLLAFMVLNPLFLYMANMVSSDGFFLALSFIWFSLLIWIIHRPSNYLVAAHALVLFMTFTVRYNALIYPLITIAAFGLSPLRLRTKIIGILGGFLLIGAFVLHTGNRYKTFMGVWQFSPFSGWQMTNNAMYAYRYVDKVDRVPVPARFRGLDNMIRTYFDSTRDVKKHPQEAILASTVYMWTPGLPLFKYRDLQFTKDTSASEFKRWATMGPLYADYGTYIIKQYPWHYIRYFLWYNAQKYYAPPIEFLEEYNGGSDYVEPIAKSWFRYKSTKVTARVKDLKVNMLGFYPTLSGIMNVLFFSSLLCFIILRGFRNRTLFRKGVLLMTAMWLLNAVFSIFSTSAALRFLAFPVLLMCTFALLLIEWLWRNGGNGPSKELQFGEGNQDSIQVIDNSSKSNVLIRS